MATFVVLKHPVTHLVTDSNNLTNGLLILNSFFMINCFLMWTSHSGKSSFWSSSRARSYASILIQFITFSNSPHGYQSFVFFFGLLCTARWDNLKLEMFQLLNQDENFSAAFLVTLPNEDENVSAAFMVTIIQVIVESGTRWIFAGKCSVFWPAFGYCAHLSYATQQNNKYI